MPLKINGNNTLEASFWTKVVGALIVALLSAGTIGAVGSLLEVQQINTKLDAMQKDIMINTSRVETLRDREWNDVSSLRERMTAVETGLDNHVEMPHR